MIPIFSIPLFLWPKIAKYYMRRLLTFRVSIVESNWIYFLKFVKRESINITREPDHYIIHYPKFGHRASVRKGNSSDILVYLQLFFNHEYSPLLNYFELADKPLVIVDVGANVGFFALYMNSFFPSSCLHCIEPSKENCAQISKQRTLNNLKVEIYQVALWTKECNLKLEARLDLLEWNFRAIEATDGDIVAVTLPGLIGQKDIPEIDILKIDIEGTEMELFRDESFMHTLQTGVRTIAIETHDSTQKAEISDRLEAIQFKVEPAGELLFAKKRQ